MAGLTQEPLVTSSEAPGEGPDARPAGEVAGRSPMRIAFDRLRKDKVAVVCFIIVVIFALIAIFAGVIANFFGVSLESVRASERVDLTTGMPLTGPPNEAFDPNHPFGLAPKSGNDLLAYWLYGARTSLVIATIAVIVATFIGVVLGLVAGFVGGVGGPDHPVRHRRLLHPAVPAHGAGHRADPVGALRRQPRELREGHVLLGDRDPVVLHLDADARIIRGEVLSLREREFVQAARVLGVPTHRILFREILPNLVAPIVVVISLGLPVFITFEAVLAFLGIGVIGRPSWGQTINAAIPYFESYPLYLWEPVLGIVVLVVALNLLGDAVRDALDPKTRR